MTTKNILFIMYDQLRFDYLSCTGHPHLSTPNFDRVAAMGVRFDRAYVQSPICGSSRMSTYTGRYASSHGAEWNGFPLRVGEMTMGDHLRGAGMDCWLIGKTHMRADTEGMERLGVDPSSIIGVRTAECGFDVWVREDGLAAEGPDGKYDKRPSPYNEYLTARGYPGPNPWAHHANAGISEGQIASAWYLANSDKQANIRQEDSETPWLTDRALEFLQNQSGPWCAHLSYIKPHWPYIAPAPYHDMYSANHVPAPNRSPAERAGAHPVFAEFAQEAASTPFHNDITRQKVIPAYMGLIKQCDDQLGRILDYLETTGKLGETMIVLTSDHGDYLGDHWMGEKGFMHDASVRVPLIIYDPSPKADGTRGTVSEALVQAIDLAPTFVEIAGATPPENWLEGRSLLPLLREGPDAAWRNYAISEYNYSPTPIRDNLTLSDADARLFMLVTDSWKMIHFEGGFRPMLFDLANDPDELIDLGDDPAHAETIARLTGLLNQWARRQSQRVTRSAGQIAAARKGSAGVGVILGAYDENDIEDKVMAAYTGPAKADFTGKP